MLTLRWFTALAGAASASVACNAIWGIDPPVVDEVATDASTDIDGAASEVGTNGGDAADEAISADCGGAHPNDAIGIFVAPDGMDGPSCGSRAAPCKTIQNGLDLARAITGKTTVFVARGTYAETIHVHAGLSLVGGWDVLRQSGGDAIWVPACRGAPSDAVVIGSDGTSAVTVYADSEADGGAPSDAGATIAALTIGSKPHASAGESIYGVVARGAGTSLELDDVVVAVASGGDGVHGATGDAGVAATGDCPSDNGANGSPAGGVGPNASASSFGSSGFVASSGGAGGAGVAGKNGAPGVAGSCVTCVACGGGLVSCSKSTTGQSCGSAGGSGCGGGAGGGGAGGGGGGASVALFAWDARVIVHRGSLKSGDGGNGGAGGSGGQGGAGSDGSPGKTGATCTTDCGGILPCGPTDAGAGSAGTSARGGTGSNGGAGGGGAGGSSFAIVSGGSAQVTIGADVSLDHGNHGAGASGAADGASGNRYP